MHFVYDFDSTLFATQRIWDMWRDMLVGAGIDAEAVDAAYREIIPLGYSPRKHVERLGMDAAAADGLVSRFRDAMGRESPAFLFDDVAPFVSARRAAHRQTILTQGDEEHQWEKMRASGVDRLIPDAVITAPDGVKAERLAEMLRHDSSPITFIDDNPHHLVPVAESGLPVTIVRMVRAGETMAAAPHELDGVAWRVIASLRGLD